MLSNRWLKNYVRTAENCQILYAKFYVLFKNIQRKIATKFLSTLVLSLALENFICAKPIQKYFNMLQSCSIGCSLANSDTKDPTVMQIRLITKSALFVYLKILQLNHNLTTKFKTQSKLWCQSYYPCYKRGKETTTWKVTLREKRYRVE